MDNFINIGCSCGHSRGIKIYLLDSPPVIICVKCGLTSTSGTLVIQKSKVCSCGDPKCEWDKDMFKALNINDSVTNNHSNHLTDEFSGNYDVSDADSFTDIGIDLESKDSDSWIAPIPLEKVKELGLTILDPDEDEEEDLPTAAKEETLEEKRNRLKGYL